MMISVGVNLFQLGVGRRPEFTPGTRLLVLRTALALHTSSRDRVAFTRLTHDNDSNNTYSYGCGCKDS